MHISHTQISQFDQIVADACIDVPLVAVFCGSRSGTKTTYTDTAYQLGNRLVDNGLGLVYGGACIGVMGAVANGVTDLGGVSVGVIPTFLLDQEIAHTKLTHLYTTDTMHTRKALMAQFASAFVVLSGGLGTLEELMEIATWRQLYQHDKPILLINTEGFFDTLIAHLHHTVREGFMTQEDLERFVVCDTPKQAVDYLKPIVCIDEPIDVEKF